MNMINKFEKSEFGKLTTITSPTTGIVMFMAKEVGKMWGHTNIKQAITRLLNSNEYKVVKKSDHPKFFSILVSNQLLPSKAQRIQLVTESGLYKLTLASNLDKAKPFRDWVTSEVLPSIRKNGYHTIADQTQKLLIHQDKQIQKQNSKDVNSKNMIEGGIKSVIEYNRQSCLLHTGKSTVEIKAYGKEIGLPSIKRFSAKEVLRNTKPSIAGGMSFCDDLTKNGFDLKTASDLSKQFVIPLFENMIKLGLNPKEISE